MLSSSVVTDLRQNTEIVDGKLYWTHGRSRSKNGRLVGSMNSEGYMVFTFKWNQYRLHRVLYCIYHELELADIEGMIIDHINGDRSDNSKGNLRLATHRVNNSNTLAHRNGKLVGATYCKSRERWRARYKVNGKYKHIGWYLTELEAHQAYVEAIN